MSTVPTPICMGWTHLGVPCQPILVIIFGVFAQLFEDLDKGFDPFNMLWIPGRASVWSTLEEAVGILRLELFDDLVSPVLS